MPISALARSTMAVEEVRGVEPFEEGEGRLVEGGQIRVADRVAVPVGAPRRLREIQRRVREATSSSLARPSSGWIATPTVTVTGVTSSSVSAATCSRIRAATSVAPVRPAPDSRITANSSPP